MSHENRILITTEVDRKKSIGEINKSLRFIEKSEQLKTIRIKIDVDQKILKTLKEFNRSLSSVNQSIGQQSNVNSQVANASEKSTSEIQKETQAIIRQTNVLNKNIETQKKYIDQATKKPNKIVTTYGNDQNSNKKTVTTAGDGKTVIGDILETSNPKKDAQDSLKKQEKLIKSAEKIDRDHYNAIRDNKKKIETLDKVHFLALQRNREIDKKEKEDFIKSAEKIDKAHYSALKTDKQRKEALDKQHYLALQQNAQRDLNFRQSVLNQRNKIDNAMFRFKDNKDTVNQLTTLSSALNGVKNRGSYSNQLQDIDNKLKSITTAASQASTHTLNFAEALRTAMVKMPVWMAASTAFFQTLRFFSDGVTYVNELNKSLTELSIVFMKSQEEVAKYGKVFHDMGMQMGITTQEIAKGAVEFARQGLSEVEMIDKMTTAVKYAKISNIDFTTSAKILTATVNSMGVSAERATDVYSYLGRKRCPLVA